MAEWTSQQIQDLITANQQTSTNTSNINSALSTVNSKLNDIYDLLYQTSQSSNLPTIFASILMLELQAFQDMDLNGEVYGKDFLFSESDENVPPMLKSTRTILNNHGYTLPTRIIDYKDYFNYWTSGGDNPFD